MTDTTVTDPQTQIDMQVAIANAQATANAAEANKQRKLEALRMAQHTLVENKRNLPVESRQITAQEITAFADTLTTYVNG